MQKKLNKINIRRAVAILTKRKVKKLLGCEDDGYPNYCCILCNKCLTDTLHDFYTHFFMNHASFRRDHVGNDHIIDRRFKPNVCGLEIESFKRSTIHGPFDTLTFKLLYKGEYILGYSGDTVADKELIDWLLEGGKHPIVHEVGSESPVCHTTPDELIELVPAEESSRVYYNHLIGRSEKKLKDAGFRPVNELKVI